MLKNLNGLNIRWNINNIMKLILILLVITDLSILLNIPLLREFLSISYFSLIPGFIILTILNLNKLEFMKKIVLSSGLSLSILMFTGLLINFLYPIINEPLSILPLIISLNIVVVSLILISLKKNVDKTSEIWNINIELEDKSLSLLILPVFFPFLAIFGTYLMNYIEFNGLILIFLFLIPVYIALILIFKSFVHKFTYPFAIWLISLSILLLYGLTSNHIIGIDVHQEFFAFQSTINNYHWNVAEHLGDAYYACISITILPTIYTVLSGISGEYIFKLVYALIGSLVPLTAYLVFKNYFKPDKAFFATLLIVFQNFFMLSLGATRQLVALLFFFLAVYVLFEPKIPKTSKKLIFLVMVFSIIISHYSTAYVALTLIIPILLIPFLKNLLKDRKISFKNFDLLTIIMVFLIIWYGMFAGIQLAAGSGSVEKTINATSSPSGTTGETKDVTVLAIIGIGIKSVPNLISVIANDLIFIALFMGLIALLLRFKYYKKKLGFRFITGISISFTLLVMFIIVPLVSQLYGAPRLFLQSLIFLAPLLVIFADEISKLFKKPKLSYVILFVLLIFLFSCSTYLNYHFYGSPYSPIYESDGKLHNEYVIIDQEVIAAKWLYNYKIEDIEIYTDAIGYQRLMLGGIEFGMINPSFYSNNKTVNNSYVYEWNTNVNKGLIYIQLEEERNITNYNNLFAGKNLIYDNGYSRIWG